jgi:predicted Zn-dependent protease
VDPQSAQQIGSLTSDASGAVSAGLILQYDRDQEFEADQIGLMIMGKAGYDPEKAIDFWKNSEKIFGSSNTLGFFKTHPSDSSRAARLQEALPIAKKYYEGKDPGLSQQVKALK